MCLLILCLGFCFDTGSIVNDLTVFSLNHALCPDNIFMHLSLSPSPPLPHFFILGLGQITVLGFADVCCCFFSFLLFYCSCCYVVVFLLLSVCLLFVSLQLVILVQGLESIKSEIR